MCYNTELQNAQPQISKFIRSRVYNHNDGFLDTQIFDLGNDGDWVYFLTNQGIIFYNWRRYHN